MKKIYLTILIAFISIYGFAQAPNWAWAKSAGGAASSYGASCSTDASGNIIVTGAFESSSITFGTTTLTNAGFKDMYIVKYDPSGNVLWAKCAGGLYDDKATCCNTDASGNIIVSGYFGSSSITFGITTLTNTGMFVVKYDSNGNVVWAKNAGGTAGGEALSCSTDASGNILVTGWFGGSSISFGTDTLTNTGIWDMFIVKYDSNGNVLWAKSAGGTGYDVAYSCSTDAGGNIVVTGYFGSSSITFGTITLTNASAGNADMFIVKYDSTGNVLWAKSGGGINGDYAYSCSTDAGANIIVAGYFSSFSITLGTITLANASVGSPDIFIVKYDSTGNVLWAKSAGGAYDDYAYSCSTDSSYNIILTGRFNSSIVFGMDTLTSANMFIVKYDSTGNVLWAKSEGFVADANSCSTDVNGNIIVAGCFQSSSITFGTTTLINAGSKDMFVAKLGGTSGIEELNNQQSSTQLYPNPAHSELRIRNYELRIKEVKIFNVLGECLLQCFNTKSETNLDVSSFAKGIYFVQIKTEKGIINRKIIKQ